MKRGWLLPFVVSAAAYLILAGLSIRKPMAGDELYALEEIRAYARGSFQKIDILGQDITFAHVPFYPLAASFLIPIFGENILLIRSIGILTMLGVLFLLVFFPFRILPDPGWARRVSWLSALTVATHPVSVQGSVILDYEATFFLLFLSLFCFVVLQSSFSMGSLAGLSLLYGLCLWARTGSALIFPFSWLVWVLFAKPRRGEALHLLFIFFGGFVLFLVTWVVFISFLWGPGHLFKPFEYLSGRLKEAGDRSIREPLKASLTDSTRFVAWFGIPWLVLFVAGLMKKMPKPLVPHRDRWDFLKIVLLFGIVGYPLVGGSSWGYPKYANPFIPMATFLFVVLLTETSPSFERKGVGSLAFCFVLVFLLSFLMIGDPLYRLCYTLKKSLMLGSPLSKEYPTLIVVFGLPLCFMLFFAFVVRRRMKPRIAFLHTWLIGSFFTLFATQPPFAMVQAYAPYPTTSIYGDEQRNRVVEILKKEVRPEELVLAPELIIPYEAGVSLSDRYEGKSRWQDPEVFLQFLKRESPKAIVYSVSTLSISSYRNVVQNREIQETLRNEFSLSTFGDYTLWLKKESSSP